MLSICYEAGDGAGLPEHLRSLPPPPPRESKSRLHNFSFPTGSWGSTRQFRCSKPSSGSALPTPVSDPKPPALAAPAPADEEASSLAARPWNLRTRRAACTAPMEKGSGSASASPAQLEKVGSGGRAGRLRSESGEKGGERRRFSVQLLKEEIEEDFYALKGAKPARRPKKRPRVVQRQLDSLFPGLWLSEVTADAYKTSD